MVPAAESGKRQACRNVRSLLEKYCHGMYTVDNYPNTLSTQFINMAKLTEKPEISAGGLVTVAFLKAQLDSGNDHLGIFQPLILDAARSFGAASFVKQEVQERLAALHGVAMPQHVIGTLLDRQIRVGNIRREVGRYKSTSSIDSVPRIDGQIRAINEAQVLLGQSLLDYAKSRGFEISTPDEALENLFRFLETEQVDLLLGGTSSVTQANDQSHKERLITAEFIRDIVANDKQLSSVLNRILEGLVLYHAAFLPDLNTANRRFEDLRVAFDSSLVRQAIGLEGEAARSLCAETIKLLKTSGVHCFVFEKSVDEIQRILSFYELHLGTSAGRSVLHGAMARHLLTNRFAPSDVRQVSATLIMKIQQAGLSIVPMPQRQKLTTLGEAKLSERLASDRAKPDEVEARVQHDVDCIAGILTLRGGHRSTTLENARAVFAADQALVIRNVVRWWLDDERETGIEPIAHIRALTNLAWIKRPAIASNYKLCELISVCTVALRPTQETWNRFLRHLEKLESEKALSEAEMGAIIVSTTSDKLLREAEVAEGEDIDITTLDEIVSKVKEDYTNEFRVERALLAGEHANEKALLAKERDDALAAQQEEREKLNARKEGFQRRANKYAHWVGRFVGWGINIALIIGVLAILGEHFKGPLKSSAAWILVGAIAVFYVLEATALREHLKKARDQFERELSDAFYRWLDPESKYED